MSENKCKWVTCLQSTGRLCWQGTEGKSRMGTNVSVIVGLTSPDTHQFSWDKKTKQNIFTNTWRQILDYCRFLDEVYRSKCRGRKPCFYVQILFNACSCQWVRVFMCVSHTLPPSMLFLLTLFNLECNQICAKTGKPVRCVSFSSPWTSLPDVHYGICLAVLKLSCCFFLILSLSLSVYATLHYVHFSTMLILSYCLWI